MKSSSDTIGNRTRDLLACSAVPPPTAPPRTPLYIELPANKMLPMQFNTSIAASGHYTNLLHMLPASVHRTDVNTFKDAAYLNPLTWNGVEI
jgi:hypothetical protein